MKNIDKFEIYLNNVPNLHSWDAGLTWNTGGFDAYHLREFVKIIDSSDVKNRKIIETGAGNSTIAFSYSRVNEIVSICPEEELFARIRPYMRENELNTPKWHSIIERSEWALPSIAKKGDTFGFALIDGLHNWPAVFVDFCYIYYMLEQWSLLIIDDIALKSVAELKNLLLSDTERFDLVANLGKAVVLRKKMDERFLPEWTEQPYIKHNSFFI